MEQVDGFRELTLALKQNLSLSLLKLNSILLF